MVAMAVFNQIARKINNDLSARITKRTLFREADLGKPESHGQNKERGKSSRLVPRLFYSIRRAAIGNREEIGIG